MATMISGNPRFDYEVDGEDGFHVRWEPSGAGYVNAEFNVLHGEIPEDVRLCLKADVLCERFFEIRSEFNRTMPGNVSYPFTDIDDRVSIFGYGVWADPGRAAEKFQAAILVYRAALVNETHTG